jgi:hypothetical protein
MLPLHKVPLQSESMSWLHQLHGIVRKKLEFFCRVKSGIQSLGQQPSRRSLDAIFAAGQ